MSDLHKHMKLKQTTLYCVGKKNTSNNPSSNVWSCTMPQLYSGKRIYIAKKNISSNSTCYKIKVMCMKRARNSVFINM